MRSRHLRQDYGTLSTLIGLALGDGGSGGQGDFASQLVWYVDPQNPAANDENDGKTALTPLKTLAEVATRLSVASMVNYTINLMSNTNSTDTFDYNPHLNGQGLTGGGGIDVGVTSFVNIVGRQTVAASGVVTSATGTTPATNTQASLDVAGVVWTPLLGSLVVMTSGALAGYQAYVIKDLGSNTARMSDWWNPTGVTPGGSGSNGTFAAIGAAPAPGDTYNIVTLTQFNATYRNAGNPARVQINFQNLQFTAAANITVEGATNSFITCQMLCNLIAVMWVNEFAQYYGCLLNTVSAQLLNFDMRLRFIGSALLNTSVQAFNTGRAEFINTVVQGGSVFVGRGFTGLPGDTSELGGQIAIFAQAPGAPTNQSIGLGIFDSPAQGFSAVRGGILGIDAPLYGSGNTTYGLTVSDGGAIMVRTGVSPTITGTTAALQLEGAATAIPPLVAGTTVPAASALTTWAQWAAGPFSGNVMDYTAGSKIITVAAPV
jgi:hypothetical protein